MHRLADGATMAAGTGSGHIGGGHPIAPTTGDFSQMLSDPVAPHFELSSVWLESLAAEPVLCMDCQSGIAAVLNQSGTLQVIDVQDDALLLRTRVKNPHRVFVDPLGGFVTVTAMDGEVYVYAVYEERLLASFSLHHHHHHPSASGTGSSTFASLSSRLRGAFHVGNTLCWLPMEEEATAASPRGGTDTKSKALNMLIGTLKNGLVFYVRVGLGPSGASSASPATSAKPSILRVLQLPDFSVEAGTNGAGVLGAAPAPVAGIAFEVVNTPTSPCVFFAVSSPVQLYRVAVPTKTAKTAEQVLALLTSGALRFEVKTVAPPPTVAGSLSRYGGLSVFRSHRGSCARSYAWSSAAGILHALFNTQPGNPLLPEEAALFGEGPTSTAADRPTAWIGEGTIPLGKLPPPRERRDAENDDARSQVDIFPTRTSPSQVLLTAFHMILLYEERCIVLNHPAGLPWHDPWRGDGASASTAGTGHLRPQNALLSNASLLSSEDEGSVPSVSDVLSRVRFDPFRGVRHGESLRGVVRDVAERKLYIYGESHLWELQIDNEHRQQWQLFLRRAMAEEREAPSVVNATSHLPLVGGLDGGSIDAPTNPSLSMRRRLFDAAYNLCRFHAAQRSAVQYLRGCFYLSVGAIDKATSVLADCELVDHVLAHLLSTSKRRRLASGTLPSVEERPGTTPSEGATKTEATHAMSDPVVAYLAKRFAFLARFQATAVDEQHQKQQREELVTFALLALGMAAPKPSLPAAPSTDESRLNAFLDKVAKACEAALPATEQRVVFDVMLHTLEESGHTAEALHLAEKVGRYSLVVAHHFANGSDRKALDMLARYTAGRPEMADMWYRHIRRLMQAFPIATVTAMLKVSAKDKQAGRAPSTLNVERFLPVFADYTVALNEEPDNTEHQVVIFLEQCVLHFDCVSSAVNNFYVALLAAQGDVERLEEVLETSLFYDAHAALRACLTHRRFSVCVMLYKRLGLYEDAVLTALQEGAPPVTLMSQKTNPQTSAASALPWPGLTTAEELLRGLRTKLDEEAYQRLWRIVAEFTIERSHNAHLALSVVDHSDGALQLADVLASIDDDHVVHDFKGAVCASLDRYAGAITQLHAKQQEAYRTAEDVKRELGDLRNQYGYVTAKQKCPLCRRSLLHGGQPMLAYPNCHHVVHERCAVALLESLGGLEAFLTDEGVSQHLMEGVGSVAELAQVDCVICGEAAIVQVDIPLCDPDPSWTI